MKMHSIQEWAILGKYMAGKICLVLLISILLLGNTTKRSFFLVVLTK